MPGKKKCKQCKKCRCGHMRKRSTRSARSTGRGKRKCATKSKCSNFGRREPYVPGKYLRQLKMSGFGFGGLETPPGMRPVSSFRKAGQYNRPFLEMPFGPPQPWLMKGPEAAASSSLPPPSAYGRRRRRRSYFGNQAPTSRAAPPSNSLKDRYVNPSGYLATWYGQGRTAPPSWNSLLLQGNNTFRQGINNPRLSQVMI